MSAPAQLPSQLPARLRSQRLALRPPVTADAEWIARDIADPKVAHWLVSLPHPYGLADAKMWLADAAGEAGQYIVELPETDGIAAQPIGSVTLRPGDERPELGYWLTPAHWGQGFMTEAASAVLAAHFQAGDTQIGSGYLLGNAASANTLRKLGFTDTDVVTRDMAMRGPVKMQRMVLSAQAWADHAG